VSTGPLPSRPHLRGPIAWMAQNPIAANLAMAILFFGGFWTILTIQKEVFPRSVLDVVEVSVGYPGAAPAEVEQGILRPVEEAVRGIEGVREITSVAREGRGSVTIELVGGAERMQAFQDIDQAIGRVRTFPEDIEEPEVRLRSRQTEVISIGLFGPVDPWTLRQLAERLRDGLLAEPEITQVELSRARSYVTHVEIPKAVLREYGLTLPDVADLIASSSNDVAAGAVRTSGGELLLRVAARKQWADQFARIEVVADETGAIVTLGDIATIRDGFEETGFPSRFNDQPAVEVDVFRVGGQSPLTIADAVERRMRLFEAELPPGVELRTDNNNAEDFRRRLELVTENGLLAVVIVLAVLSLFLELRMAFWVMMGMSVSFIGGLLFLPSAGVSINMISLFGFLIALGIVVDDAVVVGENVYEHRARGASPLEAAVHGAREMALPVTFSVLTSIVAFIPLMLIPGEVGQFWKPLPIVVVVVLAVSLLEALFILPAHLAHVRMRRDTDGPLGRPRRVKRALGDLFSRLVERGFRPLLRISLRYRYVTIAACVSVLVIVGSFSMSAHMGMIPMPEVSADEIEAGVRLPVGTTPEQAAAVAQLVTDATLRMFEEHNLAAVAEGVKTNVRGQSFVDVELVMRPPDERDMSAREVIALWRDSIGDLPGVDQISFEAERGPGGYRQDISIDISHNDIDVLEKVTADLVASGGVVRGDPRCERQLQPRQAAARLHAAPRGPGARTHPRGRRRASSAVRSSARSH
jgi:multidrug efflux pump subunit AcrB